MQKSSRIVVVSEGLLFEGFRTPRAFLWREVGAVLAKPVREVNPSPGALSYVLEYLLQANLSKEDKSQCRRNVAGMSGPELLRLTRELRSFRKHSSPR